MNQNHSFEDYKHEMRYRRHSYADRYFKSILTVIAICLMLIVIELASFMPVNASNSVIDVNIHQVGGRTIYRGIPVENNK
ncbi:hypothetical protein [Cyanobacterium aponinum]|uniref:hypothetical protein n=1 Tax=Cyanobacterium aponinum TaxID=379064 RepID=UPI001F556A55|nr:hypothetical protein [Cyanobacterium aponinum]